MNSEAMNPIRIPITDFTTEAQRHREIGIHQNGSGSVSLCLCGEIRGSDHFVTVARNDSKAYIASCPLGLSP
jgi:hypothetical protein